ncbi:MAG: acetyl-CoA carboxylase carboxyltransferase subunit alpha [Peptococcaceae bacterium]|nr:acetyl-CoA carboxylase carboxyltransferase subunit alpha [Peptococcaceae bacterium]
MKTIALDHVKIARDSKRPTSLDYIHAIFPDFFELHGDRLYADDAAIVGGVATLAGQPVTIIGIEKGKSIKERNRRNFGAPHPEGYRKALRLMRQADKFHRPIITFIDTSGAYCGIGAEERGQGEAIAQNLVEMMGLSVPIIAILIGEGGSGGALALGVANRVWMLEHAIYSVISPEGCASILWKDAAKANVAADSLKLTAADALSHGFIDKIIPEKDLGSRVFYKDLEKLLRQELVQLAAVDDPAAARYARFRAFGRDAIKEQV